MDFDKLWIYFQQGGAEIWNADETVYLGTFEGDPGEYIIEINGPDEYPVPYCKSRTDLPRIVDDFVEYGGSLTDLARVIDDSPSQHVDNLNNQNQPLTGPELLAKIKELGDVAKSDLVRACGYSSPKDGGGERLNFTGFYEALLTAKGDAMSSNNADSDESSVEENVDQQDLDLPADWQDLDGEQLVSKLRNLEQVDIDVLRVLASFEDWSVRQAVAWHDSTPDDVLKTLSNDDDSDVSNATRDRDLPKSWRFMSRVDRIEALKSDDVSSEIIDLLASSEDWTIRQAVAWSPSATESILEKLKDDEDEDIQVAVTTERRLPVDWRFMSGWDKAERLREESTELAILEILVQSRDSDVRRAVALHPTTPERLLNTLQEDSDDSVQSGIRERDLPESWKMLDEGEMIAALKGDEVSDSVISILSKSHSWRIRQAVALSARTSQEILDELLNDSDEDVQSAVRERALPDEWKQLDEDEKVEKLNQQQAPAQVLEILSRSGQWLVRQAVAQNPGSSEEILKILIENDSDDDVVKAAKKSLKKFRGSGEQDEDEEKTIYIKTEPGGHVLFGQLSEEQIDELRICIDNQELSEELSEIGDNSYGQLAECDGVVNSGDEGDCGNEGTITYSTDQSVLGPEVDEDGTYEDGIYVVVMKLSKCSIEFEFNAEGGFDEDEFEEISVPVRIPEEIEHGLYGHPDFNIITGFRFRGEDVEEYEGEVEDRGYDTQLTFFAIKDGETHILYSNYNGEEDWHSREKSVDFLENQQNSFNRPSGNEPDFLRSSNISYVTVEIEDPNELNAELIDDLHKKFEEEAIDAPFCNDGDYDIDDLKSDLPEGWTIREIPSKKSSALIILAEISYNASRDIDFDAFEHCELEYCRLCGCYPIFACNADSENDPFGGDFVTYNTDKTLMIQTYNADGEYEYDEVEAEDFADKVEDWREMIVDAKKQ